MSKTKNTSVQTTVSEEVMNELRASYPMEPSALRIQLPRISMVSQDLTEETKNAKTGKKEIKVITEAGTFSIERQSDEDEIGEDGEKTGKKVWEKIEIGTKFEGTILFKRKQLRLYDESTELYTSSPIYDTEDEIIPLFCDRKEISRGTPAELKAEYQYTDEESGKIKSKLEDNRILYVLYEGDVYQLNLRGSSMYSFMSYERKVTIPAVLTEFSSIAKEKGTIAWNQMMFEAIRDLNGEEATEVLTHVRKIKSAIEIEKQSYASVQAKKKEGDAELDEMADDAKKLGDELDKPNKPKAITAPKKK